MSMPHSEFLAWDADDREVLFEQKAWLGECCEKCGIHPSTWKKDLGGHPNRVVAEWRFCRVCELIEQAQKAGPPSDTPGWHLSLRHNPV